MKRSRIRVEHHGQEMAVPFPHRQFEDAFNRNPLERALGIGICRRSAEAFDQEHEAKPVFTGLAKSWPTDRAAQREFFAFDAGL